MRYYILLYGLLIVFAAWALIALWDRRPTTDTRYPIPDTRYPITDNR